MVPVTFIDIFPTHFLLYGDPLYLLTLSLSSFMCWRIIYRLPVNYSCLYECFWFSYYYFWPFSHWYLNRIPVIRCVWFTRHRCLWNGGDYFYPQCGSYGIFFDGCSLVPCCLCRSYTAVGLLYWVYWNMVVWLSDWSGLSANCETVSFIMFLPWIWDSLLSDCVEVGNTVVCADIFGRL